MVPFPNTKLKIRQINLGDNMCSSRKNINTSGLVKIKKLPFLCRKVQEVQAK